ncbi:hypothetical protein [Burkholderia ubonensis]|uniref:hypothetical protein n=1 Tax=Burkholderia ubonensis TaxID=101571 RepID=UPI000B127AF4|nr:hypothetical protein [Burkholderia ubonensis]
MLEAALRFKKRIPIGADRSDRRLFVQGVADTPPLAQPSNQVDAQLYARFPMT